MFMDKIQKAQREISKTNERLSKLKGHKKQMQLQVNILKLKDKSQSSGKSLSSSGSSEVVLAHDSVLQIKLHSVSGVNLSQEEASRVYVQALIEDDTYNSEVRILVLTQQFGVAHGSDIDFQGQRLDLTIPKLTSTTQDEAQVFLIIRVSDQVDNFSYLDKMLSTVRYLCIISLTLSMRSI